MIRLIPTLLFLVISCALYAQDARIVRQLCNFRESPGGIDSRPPVFSWEVSAGGESFVQSAYRITVNGAGASWNSGKVNSGQSINVPYTGKSLSPAQLYHWQVEVWDKNGRSFKSGVDSFSTALFGEKDWSGAKWIGYDDLPDSMLVVPGVHGNAKSLGNRAKERAVVPLFRKEFSIDKKVKRAMAYVSGLGHYEMTINGEKAGNSFLAPGWTYYDKRVLYNTYDITSAVRNGENAIGVIVGNGFYHINRERYFKLISVFGLPKMICKIQVDYEDGSQAVIVSDQSWKTAPSPVTYTSIFGGEDYDATLEQAGWNEPGFRDAPWKQAMLVKAPKGELEPESIYPVKIMDSFTPVKVLQPKPGVYLYDFGQNASGIVELKVKGKKGQQVKLIPAELIKDTLANQRATGRPYYFSYTLKGEGVETWQPKFTYYGFRYVQVEGAVPDTAANEAGAPVIVSLKELHNSTSAPEAGTFTCSNDLFNRINTLIKWAIKSNIQSVVTDCPHREKLSWLEQDYLMGNSIRYNLELYQLYRKLVYDMIDAQTPDGLIPDIAPEFVVFEGGFRDSPEWGSAGVILPWLLYKWYGDTNIMRDAYPMMKKYVAYLESKSSGHILSHGLGDWFDYGPNRPGEAQLTPKELTATAIYYYDVALLGKMAALLKDRQEVSRLGRKAGEIKAAFNRKFFNDTTKVYSTGSQTAMAMPLCVGLVAERDRKAVFQNLVDSIRHSGKKLTAGDVGYHFLVEALHAGGASQLLFDMNYRDDVPGYGFQLKKGATALTESWPALEEVSNNHLMLGHIMEWFYYGLAGISQSETSVAYKDIVIRPEVVGDLTHARGTFHSPYGLITSEWKKENGRFGLDVEIPANTTATVYLPDAAGKQISRNRQPLKQVKIGKDGRAVIKTGAGKHSFEVRE
ncbi:family 78 glycoside hydrolase catalytic domain [Chitinophaga cymbidii]|nr:family 78 glycoside hydrolase catalytic domain [Chitinophaga cymbidii]